MIAVRKHLHRSLTAHRHTSAPGAAFRMGKPKNIPGGKDQFEGFGAEFHPGAWAKIGHGGDVNHAAQDKKVVELAVDHTRIFVPGALMWSRENMVKRMEASTDPAQKARIEKQIKYYDDRLQSFEKACDLAAKSGATVNLTLPGASLDFDVPYKMNKMADLVEKLNQKGVKNVEITLENEADRAEQFSAAFRADKKQGGTKHMDAYAQKYVSAYKTLGETLGARGLREGTKIIGGDICAEHRKEFMAATSKAGLGKYVDGISFHIYWTGNVKNGIAELKADRAMGQKYFPGKPLSITEFGKKAWNGHQNVPVEKGTKVALEQGQFMLAAANLGFRSTDKWHTYYGGQYKKGDGYGDYKAFEMVRGNKTDATYSLMKMFTHATEPGWRVMSGSGTHGSQTATLFRGPDGHAAALALNDADTAKPFAAFGLKPGQLLYVTVWNKGGNGKCEAREIHADAHGRVQVQLPAEGGVSVSTIRR